MGPSLAENWPNTKKNKNFGDLFSLAEVNAPGASPTSWSGVSGDRGGWPAPMPEAWPGHDPWGSWLGTLLAPYWRPIGALLVALLVPLDANRAWYLKAVWPEFLGVRF